ncbi:nitrite reductase (plasmid) [Paenibacillus urinalis]|uniref:Nitrite reductase n=1 Tax=Paenibacillus urinalis TaxID=521520 RepID=A0AAX3N8G7_9BACL|nr:MULTISPECIES: nitrite reductase [Paenibacillus]MCM3131059.1 nitrite reductase [Paenibacillus sp. MER 78]WDH85354.1 nitrite reductase [Paenibacillus urinalis]WDH95207.1 nitrite reductase [Paenibacillus urinalis]WDI05317.1 nitrite reductase [Paenibacillus urinalis]
MGENIKIAVNPPIQVGGSLFTPEQLVKIGTLADSQTKLEMTPFKQLYMEVPVNQRDRITKELREAGLEVYPSGFVVKSLIACNFCKGAEDAGLDTALRLNEAIAGIETPTPIKIGYAGCGLGTSEPLLKDISVVKMKSAFDIYVGGEPKGLKASIATKLLTGLVAEQLVPVIKAIIHYYIANAKGKEKFSKFVNRVSLDELKRVAG